MEYSSAEMVCVLKVNTQCEVCKVKMMQVLKNIRGVYSITLDGENGTVKVTGRVNPSTLLGVLEKYGRHAELKYARFDGEVVPRIYGYCGDYGYNPYVRECLCPQPQWNYGTSTSFFPPTSQAPFWAVPPPPPPPGTFRPPPPPPVSAPFWPSYPFGHVPRGLAPAKMEKERNFCTTM